MSHFKRIKKGHFRTIKGWKKEVEEMSMVFLLVILVVVGFSASVAHAQSNMTRGIVFYGRVIYVQPCGTPFNGPPPCQLLLAPNIQMTLFGRPLPRVEGPPVGFNGLPPVPNGWVMGFAFPPLATQYWAYPATQ